jgi:hypothetical protein
MNEPLIREAVAHIRKYPESWDQDVYEHRSERCGTQRCLAGWLLALHYDMDSAKLAAIDHHGTTDIGAAAAEITGLDFDQADIVFYQTMGITDVDEFVRIIERVTGLDLSE